MSLTVDYTQFCRQLEKFAPESYVRERSLALYAASIAVADDRVMSDAVGKIRPVIAERTPLYEVVLQSYLFLGFPRMLIAAEHLDRIWPVESLNGMPGPISEQESRDWFSRGESLYERVYRTKADPLKRKVVRMAPEVFRWMLIEGYGKVLSRPELDIVTRELCIVAQLTIENREKQLHSHLFGAVNVGASRELISLVVEDIGVAAGKGFETAKRLIERLGN